MPADLRQVRTFRQLVRYLEDELGWPLEGYEMEDLTFDYEPADLGLKDEDAAKVKSIRQLRPLASDQPWGIFFIEFDKKKLPVVLLRRILSHLVVKKRASANKADRAAWNADDLLFVSAFGPEDEDGREIGFAHFHQESGDLPSLRVLGWDGADTSLKLQTVAATLRERLHWPEKGEKLDAWRERWAKAFRHRIGHIIRTSDLLAEAMAALAKRIRDAATTIMQHETESGPLRKLHRAFQTHLIHDLTEEGFADTYAQTITYGLLTAAISRTEMSEGRRGTALIASNISDMVPVTNPFLKEMLETFLNVGGRKGGMDFDELGIQDVVELLRGEETDLPAILRDFGNKTAGEDPIIHFYEHFLNAYNKKLKVQRGVFYTPQPVVSYIVRSVHELLQTEFGLEDGLADTTTWGEMVERHPDLKLPTTFDDKNIEQSISPDEPFVQILDPATGTATFLVEVIDVIHKHLEARWKKGGFAAMPPLPASSASPAAPSEHSGAVPANSRGLSESASDTPGQGPKTKGHPGGVPASSSGAKPLAPLRGADISVSGSGGVAGAQPPANFSQPSGVPPALRTFAEYWNLYVPRALLPRLHAFELMMAPYAIAHMKIGLKLAETGYRFGTEERARIYLTNALEPWVKQLPLIGFDALAHEAAAVNEIKRHKRFTVVIGNPPYSNFGQLNRTEFLLGLLADYKRGLNEKKLNLDDDFIKFVRFGQHVIEQSGVGALGLITNNVFLDGITHRQMRRSLSQSFPTIRILDLHGSARKLETGRDGGEENVFEIQQGVAVEIFSCPVRDAKPCLLHADLWGTRESKYRALDKNSISSTAWALIESPAPNYFFVPKTFETGDDFQSYPGLKEIFITSGNAIKTERDRVSIHFTVEDAKTAVEHFRSKDEAFLRREYDLETDSRDWKVANAKADVRDNRSEKLFRPILYRPFDIRHTWYSGQTRGFIGTPAYPTMKHLIAGSNMAMACLRQTRRAETGTYLVGRGLIGKDIVSIFDIGTVFPLYLYEETLAFDVGHKSLGAAQGLSKRPNFTPAFLKAIASALKLAQKGEHGLSAGLTPEDIFHYAYAVFHSPGYRSRYAEFLKIDFPRLPLTGNIELFRALARLGGELTALHLLESPMLDQPITEFVGGRNSEVGRVAWSNDNVWINAGGTKNATRPGTTGFRGVPEAVWNFHIGGYQVCEKWLKDRKGRTLSDEDIAHYHRIVVALSETIRLMTEIDEVIDLHGGWPAAFASTSSADDSADGPYGPASEASSPPRTDDPAWQEDELPLG